MGLKEWTKGRMGHGTWEASKSLFYLAKDSLMEALFAVLPKESTREYLGYRLSYPTGSNMVNAVKDGEIYEEAICSMIEQELKKRRDSCFVDIGANIGLISLYVARKVPTAYIYSFEPGPSQFYFLEKNVRENRLSFRMELSSDAISDKEGVAEFFCHISRNSVNDGFIDTGKGNTKVRKAKKNLVRTVTLDSWWEERNRPRVGAVKLDTEGSELLCLRGGSKMITENAPIIFLEIMKDFLRQYSLEPDSVIAFFEKIGYELFTNRNEKVDRDNFDEFLMKGENYCYCYCARPKLVRSKT